MQALFQIFQTNASAFTRGGEVFLSESSIYSSIAALRMLEQLFGAYVVESLAL